MCGKGWAEEGTEGMGRGAPLSLPGAAGALPVLFFVGEIPAFTPALCRCRGDFGP